MAPDTTSIPGYTIYREDDYGSSSAASQITTRQPHPLGMPLLYTSSRTIMEGAQSADSLVQIN